jgi:hypothetical protein
VDDKKLGFAIVETAEVARRGVDEAAKVEYELLALLALTPDRQVG